jgi:hypothetical protein
MSHSPTLILWSKNEFGNRERLAPEPNFLEAVKEEIQFLTKTEKKKYLKEAQKLLRGFAKLPQRIMPSRNIAYAVTAIPTSGGLLHEIRERSFKYFNPEQILPPEIIDWFQQVPDVIQLGGIIMVVIMALIGIIMIIIGKQDKAKDIIQRSIKGLVLLIAIPTILYAVYLTVGFILGFENVVWVLKR